MEATKTIAVGDIYGNRRADILLKMYCIIMDSEFRDAQGQDYVQFKLKAIEQELLKYGFLVVKGGKTFHLHSIEHLLPKRLFIL